MKQTTKNNAGRQTSKRIAVLNKLLMKNITDLMATGENSNKLIGYSLEISKVIIIILIFKQQGNLFNVLNSLFCQFL